MQYHLNSIAFKIEQPYRQRLKPWASEKGPVQINEQGLQFAI
jgi:hypothetical protein